MGVAGGAPHDPAEGSMEVAPQHAWLNWKTNLVLSVATELYLWRLHAVHVSDVLFNRIAPGATLTAEKGEGGT